MALAALVGTTALMAQDNKTARKQTFEKTALNRHWFVDLGWSATTTIGREQPEAFGKTSVLNFNAGIGRWHNPYFATRLQLQGGELRESLNLFTERWEKNNYALGHIDFMFDVVNFFAPYKEKRFFHLIPFVGVGLGHRWTDENKALATWDKTKKTSAIALAGLQLKFRLASWVDFNLEGQAIAHDFGVRVFPEGTWAQGILSAGAGLTFHLGHKEFTPVNSGDPNVLADLNNQLNTLRAENAELRKRPEHCPEVALPVAKGVAVGNVVYFRLNSDKVDANQLINIRNIAEYAKNNTEVITLVGYADRETGTPDYNFKLSERRAKAVKKVLVEKYGISADRIKTDWKGDREQPYDENVWNRIVIMSAED